ncbi:MAG TPA: hypothetical protein PLD20_12255 [Blastocatellia bacterium]|nr:hypothetical protein [Blastocatellia bacterium]HMV85487.1 hypothetical protein [Blastocatellia bacterium]HMX26277.1 hypothetical protein [Blastocatellia bacterium]HMY71570.1 hypothetical protein [Blastocatellia bacterium]HMZ18698.1 hypothetical protein [Blastocatellia bacterium]
MNRGELPTRLTIWIAIGGYMVSTVGILLRRSSLVWQARARWSATVGCAALALHIVCALHFYHDWSQASAYREVERQTAEVTGAAWGGGLFINYAFLALWMADVVWWWRGLEPYRRRHWLITAAWHGLFVFMFFNATVVFKTGWVRWLGAALCAMLFLLWRKSVPRTLASG